MDLADRTQDLQAMSNTIHIGSNLDVLPTLPDNSIDSIVTDPPYELGFMGKSWDSTGIAYNVTLWRECLRVLKPGGHLLAFSGSRTYHRMACAIEDAGFEVRDQIMWVYGSGFPKSHNISKAMDKNGGKDLTWFIDYVIKTAEEKGITKAELSALFPSKNGNPTGWLWNKQNGQGITLEQYNKIKDFLCLPFESIEEVERSVIGVGKAGLTKGNIANFAGKTEFEITAPATNEAKQWDGWGTALKPAHEPICVARKPLDGTVVDNVRKWGVGGLNIDGCRVGHNEDLSVKRSTKDMDTNGQGWGFKAVSRGNEGRFPANIIHDGSQQVLDLFPESKSSSQTKQRGTGGIWSSESNTPCGPQYGDKGSAARFFYCPKASKDDRDDGCDEFEEKRESDRVLDSGVGGDNPRNRTNKPRANFHPTVKPTDLMAYLCRLVTPTGGTILDPFMGSGSTGRGAVIQGFNFIGIELSPEYAAIAEARIKAAIP